MRVSPQTRFSANRAQHEKRSRVREVSFVSGQISRQGVSLIVQLRAVLPKLEEVLVQAARANTVSEF